MSASEVSLLDQVACAKRELALRKRVYPAWVTAKRMNPLKAESEILAMTAIVRTLEELQKGASART